ncbi:MAG: tetratricopeptide repeat protein [Gemmataceae bacterium]|nr:tetratricopeptide repeat protein [Gemmataceae bacterium]
MTPYRAISSICTACLFALLPALAEQPPDKPAADVKLPMCGLAPAKIIPDLCVFKYRVSTSSPECQALFEQGMGYYYSYVWMEAARSFETAARHDPDCAMAWWGLSRAMEKWSKGDGNQALAKAKEKQPLASHREQLLITARLQEKGQLPNIADADRRKTAARTLDEVLALYDDDEEAWFYRGQISENAVQAIPYYKALLRINPLHPGANHELVHLYENQRRPALGWPYAENYMKSSPGMPHAFHMQAHLATRLGRWDKTSDRSARAIELQRAYHKEMKVRPAEDHQFAHHLEILTVSLVHDGRFREARAVKQEAQSAGYRHPMPWFRLHLAERSWDDAQKMIDSFRKSDKLTQSYLSALLHLRQANHGRAAADVEVLQQAFQNGKSNKQLELRLWETQGLLMCQTGAPDAGLKLIFKAVERVKDDFSHHAWGNGAYYMESWGTAALQCGKDEMAEEAFLEALAHDPGSVRAALGLQVLCSRCGRIEEAERYAELARRCWKKADAGALESELAWLKHDFKPQAVPNDEKTNPTEK